MCQRTEVPSFPQLLTHHTSTAPPSGSTQLPHWREGRRGQSRPDLRSALDIKEEEEEGRSEHGGDPVQIYVKYLFIIIIISFYWKCRYQGHGIKKKRKWERNNQKWKDLAFFPPSVPEWFIWRSESNKWSDSNFWCRERKSAGSSLCG